MQEPIESALKRKYKKKSRRQLALGIHKATEVSYLRKKKNVMVRITFQDYADHGLILKRLFSVDGMLPTMKRLCLNPSQYKVLLRLRMRHLMEKRFQSDQSNLVFEDIKSEAA
jgi:hypothetical protein